MVPGGLGTATACWCPFSRLVKYKELVGESRCSGLGGSETRVPMKLGWLLEEVTGGLKAQSPLGSEVAFIPQVAVTIAIGVLPAVR